MENKFRKLLLIVFVATIGVGSFSCRGDWQSASRESANLAPSPTEYNGPVVVAFAAAAYGWKGYLADHTWVATKRTDETEYTIYEVVGWRANRGRPVVRVQRGVPDRHWYGAEPRLLGKVEGEDVEVLIDRVEEVIEEYPWSNTYQVFPGPNSNTFTAWVAKQIPELGIKMPLRAVGKSYIMFEPKEKK